MRVSLLGIALVAADIAQPLQRGGGAVPVIDLPIESQGLPQMNVCPFVIAEKKRRVSQADEAGADLLPILRLLINIQRLFEPSLRRGIVVLKVSDLAKVAEASGNQ